MPERERREDFRFFVTSFREKFRKKKKQYKAR